MRASDYLLTTYKETPNDAVVTSHRLMLRAGFIKKLGSGLYTWMPLGLRVLRKVENIIREEMDRAGAHELFMPAVQPAELWQETGRWDEYGPLLLKITDQNQREFCFGPTHEEVITDIMRDVIKSYKQLPLIVYQIQSKFRDEIRPRFGVMRAREFTMKDAYSFDLDQKSAEETYEKMFAAYQRIFDRLGLNYRPVLADTGNIGGTVSHEFHVLANSGEDAIFYSNESDYCANRELAEAILPPITRPSPTGEMTKVETPNERTIETVCQFLKMPAQKTVKTLVVNGTEHPLVALILRGDHELNELKAAKHPWIADPLMMADIQEIESRIGCQTGFLGPVNLTIPFITDRSASVLSDFVCGANEQGFHLTNVNWERDVALGEIADLRNVEVGDPSPDGKGTLEMCRGIEVGHIFQLGDKYSQSMKANVLNEAGKSMFLQMGCYGIGVSRIVAAAIEQNHDGRGIIWNESLTPFDIVLIPVNLHKSQRLREAADTLYAQLCEAGYSVLYDDRKERTGVLFADHELIGITHQLIISDRHLDAGTLEYKRRGADENQTISADAWREVISASQPQTV